MLVSVAAKRAFGGAAAKARAAAPSKGWTVGTSSVSEDTAAAAAVERSPLLKTALRSLLASSSFWINVHLLELLEHSSGFYSAGLAFLLLSMFVAIGVAATITLYGIRGDLPVHLSCFDRRRDATGGKEAIKAQPLLDLEMLRQSVRLVPALTLTAGINIDQVVLLPWKDDRCDGLPQKRLLVACGAVLVLAEGPMLIIKAGFSLETEVRGLAIFSILLSLARLYRGLFHKVLVYMLTRKRRPVLRHAPSSTEKMERPSTQALTNLEHVRVSTTSRHSSSPGSPVSSERSAKRVSQGPGMVVGPAL